MSLNRYDTATERQLRQLRMDQGREAAEKTPEGLEHITSRAEAETPTTEQSREEESEEEEEEEEEKKSPEHPKHVRRRDEDFEKYLRSLHSSTADTPAASDSTSRAKIVELFKVASQKENLKKRKKAMQKRVQWIITKGGAASISQVTPKERAYFAGGQIIGTSTSFKLDFYCLNLRLVHFDLIDILDPPFSERQHTRNPGQHLSEEDETLFSEQLEQTTKETLVPTTVTNTTPSAQSTSNVESTHVPSEPEDQPTLERAATYESQLLEAASAWLEHPPPPKANVLVKERPPAKSNRPCKLKRKNKGT
jgi:hypothetical protein